MEKTKIMERIHFYMHVVIIILKWLNYLLIMQIIIILNWI